MMLGIRVDFFALVERKQIYHEGLKAKINHASFISFYWGNNGEERNMERGKDVRLHYLGKCSA